VRASKWRRLIFTVAPLQPQTRTLSEWLRSDRSPSVADVRNMFRSLPTFIELLCDPIATCCPHFTKNPQTTFWVNLLTDDQTGQTLPRYKHYTQLITSDVLFISWRALFPTTYFYVGLYTIQWGRLRQKLAQTSLFLSGVQSLPVIGILRPYFHECFCRRRTMRTTMFVHAMTAPLCDETASVSQCRRERESKG